MSTKSEILTRFSEKQSQVQALITKCKTADGKFLFTKEELTQYTSDISEVAVLTIPLIEE